MMNRNDRRQKLSGRDSSVYILNFIAVGILVFGSTAWVIAYYLDSSITLFVLIGGTSGAICAWIVGSLLDIRKEIEYRSRIRHESLTMLREETEDNIRTHNL